MWHWFLPSRDAIGRPATRPSVLSSVVASLRRRCEDRSARQLHQVHRNAVAVRHRRLLDRRHVFAGATVRHFAGKLVLGGRRSPRWKTFPHGFRRQVVRSWRPRRSRTSDDLFPVSAPSGCASECEAADRERARCGFDDRVRAHGRLRAPPRSNISASSPARRCRSARGCGIVDGTTLLVLGL